MESCDKLKDARTHLRHAARAMEERVIGKEVTKHLRDAARSMLQAGIAAIDERDRHTTEQPKP